MQTLFAILDTSAVVPNEFRNSCNEWISLDESLNSDVFFRFPWMDGFQGPHPIDEGPRPFRLSGEKHPSETELRRLKSSTLKDVVGGNSRFVSHHERCWPVKRCDLETCEFTQSSRVSFTFVNESTAALYIASRVSRLSVKKGSNWNGEALSHEKHEKTQGTMVSRKLVLA